MNTTHLSIQIIILSIILLLIMVVERGLGLPVLSLFIIAYFYSIPFRAIRLILWVVTVLVLYIVYFIALWQSIILLSSLYIFLQFSEKMFRYFNILVPLLVLILAILIGIWSGVTFNPISMLHVIFTGLIGGYWWWKSRKKSKLQSSNWSLEEEWL